jgi:hypothetical protein
MFMSDHGCPSACVYQVRVFLWVDEKKYFQIIPGHVLCGVCTNVVVVALCVAVALMS